jgi:hypothetical protein
MAPQLIQAKEKLLLKGDIAPPNKTPPSGPPVMNGPVKPNNLSTAPLYGMVDVS